MVQFMLLTSLVLNPLPDAVVDRIDRYADELGVTNDMLRIAHRLRAWQLRARARRLSAQRLHGDLGAGAQRSAPTSRELSDAGSNAVTTMRLRNGGNRCGILPVGTLGRSVSRFYDARGFAFPGRPRQRPTLLAQHDWVQCSPNMGRPSNPNRVFAFIARANDRSASLLATGANRESLRDGIYRRRVGTL